MSTRKRASAAPVNPVPVEEEREGEDEGPGGLPPNTTLATFIDSKTLTKALQAIAGNRGIRAANIVTGRNMQAAFPMKLILEALGCGMIDDELLVNLATFARGVCIMKGYPVVDLPGGSLGWSSLAKAMDIDIEIEEPGQQLQRFSAGTTPAARKVGILSSSAKKLMWALLPGTGRARMRRDRTARYYNSRKRICMKKTGRSQKKDRTNKEQIGCGDQRL